MKKKYFYYGTWGNIIKNFQIDLWNVLERFDTVVIKRISCLLKYEL